MADRDEVLIRQLQAEAQSGPDLLTVRGIVSSGGAEEEGTGFSSERQDFGDYTVVFIPPFSDVPAVTVTLVEAEVVPHLNGVAADGFGLRVRNFASALTDSAFHFVAVGPA